MCSVADLLTDAYCKPGEIGPWLDHVLADGPQAPTAQPPPPPPSMAGPASQSDDVWSSPHAGRRSRSEGQAHVGTPGLRPTPEASRRTAAPPVTPGALPQDRIDALRAARGHKGIMAVAKHIVHSLRERGVPAQFLRPTRHAPPAATPAASTNLDAKTSSPSLPVPAQPTTAADLPAASSRGTAAGFVGQHASGEQRSEGEHTASTLGPGAVAEGVEGHSEPCGQECASSAQLQPHATTPEASGASAARGGDPSGAAASGAGAQTLPRPALVSHIRKLTPPPIDVDIDDPAPSSGDSPGKSPFSGVPRRAAWPARPAVTKSQSMPKASARGGAALAFRSPVPRLALRNWSVVVTGHSLGAGVAAFVLLWLRLAFPAARAHAWLFGCPAGLMSAEATEILAPWCTQARPPPSPAARKERRRAATHGRASSSSLS